MPNKQDTELTPHPGFIRSTPVIWPVSRQQSNQIQQTKISAKPRVANVIPTTTPNQSAVAPRTTPAPVSNVRVILRPSAGSKMVTVQFAHPPGDQYFSGANVYLRQSGQQPVQVAGGAKSPLTFTVDNHPAPHSIYVTSVSNWGETAVLNSPSHPVKLG